MAIEIALPLRGSILDLGGGGEGVIGRAYGVVKFDAKQDGAHFIRPCEAVGLRLSAHTGQNRCFYLCFNKETP